MTIRGSIDAPCQQVFSGEGRVIITPGRVAEVYPQWFGAAGDGQHDDTAAIQAAFDALPEGGVIRFAPGRYANTGMTVHSVLFIGTSPHEHTFPYTDSAMRTRTSFLPDTFDRPMKLGPLDLSPRGEMGLSGRAVKPQEE